MFSGAPACGDFNFSGAGAKEIFSGRGGSEPYGFALLSFFVFMIME